jgi:hypothetical protein
VQKLLAGLDVGLIHSLSGVETGRIPPPHGKSVRAELTLGEEVGQVLNRHEDCFGDFRRLQLEGAGMDGPKDPPKGDGAVVLEPEFEEKRWFDLDAELFFRFAPHAGVPIFTGGDHAADSDVPKARENIFGGSSAVNQEVAVGAKDQQVGAAVGQAAGTDLAAGRDANDSAVGVQEVDEFLAGVGLGLHEGVPVAGQ